MLLFWYNYLITKKNTIIKKCQQDHIPNKVTQEALKKAQSLRGTKKAKTVEDLLKQLSK